MQLRKNSLTLGNSKHIASGVTGADHTWYHVMKFSPTLAASARTATPERIAAGTIEAIVIGAGASGGLASLLLTQAGLTTLVLDAGVGMGLSPSAWLKHGDVVRVQIDGIGAIENRFVDDPPR